MDIRPLPNFLLIDLDDTILSYSAAGDQCWEDLCTFFAPQLGNISSDELLSAINQSRQWFWSDPERHRRGRLDLINSRREIVAMAFDQLNIGNHRIGQELADSFTTRREELAQPFPGSLEALRTLRDKGIHMGLITNGDAQFQRPKIRRFGLEQYFDSILIESELGVGKPEKRIFLYALRQLGASPIQAWMVGDNLRLDIQPAHELGMDTVWVDYDKKGLPADSPVVPASIINSLMELLKGP